MTKIRPNSKPDPPNISLGTRPGHGKLPVALSVMYPGLVLATLAS